MLRRLRGKVEKKNTGDVLQRQQRAGTASLNDTGPRIHRQLPNTPPTSLWEELRVDVFKGLFVDDSAGTFLEDKMERQEF